MKQLGLFDWEKRYDRIDKGGDPLMKLNNVIDWEGFRPVLMKIREKERKSNAGAKPYDVVLMFKSLIIQSLYNLSDDELEYQILDRLTFMRFLGLGPGERVSDAKTICLFREQLEEASLVEELFTGFERHLQASGFVARKGQIVDASIVSVPKQRNTREENALIKEWGPPQTDRLSAAVQKSLHPEEFTQRYQALLKHYGMEGRRTQAASPNENGDIEQRNYRIKRALKQALLLRGSSDFASLENYKQFLKELFARLNSGRKERYLEEQRNLLSLPEQRLESCKRLRVRVGPSSTIRVNHNVYSVESRLIGEGIEVHLYSDHLDLYYGQKCVGTLPRLRGEKRSLINYRHMIDQLERKPGAFENYRWREEMFPGSYFRLAYDELKKRHTPQQAAKEYLKILRMAAGESETAVVAALSEICGKQEITAFAVEEILHAGQRPEPYTGVSIARVDLAAYDRLLLNEEVSYASWS